MGRLKTAEFASLRGRSGGVTRFGAVPETVAQESERRAATGITCPAASRRNAARRSVGAKRRSLVFAHPPFALTNMWGTINRLTKEEQAELLTTLETARAEGRSQTRPSALALPTYIALATHRRNDENRSRQRPLLCRHEPGRLSEHDAAISSATRAARVSSAWFLGLTVRQYRALGAGDDRVVTPDVWDRMTASKRKASSKKSSAKKGSAKRKGGAKRRKFPTRPVKRKIAAKKHR
jgi:hypothetical protein